MLRIDESSKTLVAPQEAAFVAEAAPARDELLALVSSGWQAFAGEIGHAQLSFCVAGEAGADVVAFDAAAGRAAVVHVADDARSALGAALASAAGISGRDAAQLAELHESLSAAVPGDSPKIVLVGGGWDEETLATMDWLVRRHGLEITAYAVQTLRFGSERLMNVSRAYPASEGAAPVADPAAFFAQVGSAAPPAHAGASAPPPGVPAA
jgi:hypothetical protein